MEKEKWFHYIQFVCFVLVLFCFGYTHAVAECMSGSKVKCFDCNSYDDHRCADPFNWTAPPPVKLCEGCCVKIVQGIDTPEEKVRRTCTDELDINLFIVDHVCMSEGGGKGKMCFCEENECNRSPKSMTPYWSSSMTMFWSHLILTLLLLLAKY